MDDGWAALQRTPAFGLSLTLFVYVLATRLQQLGRRHPLLNPVAISVVALVGILTLVRVPYPAYFASAQVIHLMLGPATVALAVPLYGHLKRVSALAVPLAVSLSAGCLTAIVSALALARVLHITPLAQLALSVKSATAPIAMSVAASLGGDPSLTGALTIMTGILGAVLGPLALDAIRVDDAVARGFALGTASHGIGTARALEMGEEAGGFSGLAMGLNAMATAAVLPAVARLVGLP